MKYTERLMSRELRKWSDITADPYWYQSIGPEKLQFTNPKKFIILPRMLGASALTLLGAEIEGKSPTKKEPKHTLYLTFEELLANDQVSLGSLEEGCYNWDSERKDLNKIVIHHSRSPEPMRSHYLSAMELLRLYVPVYNFPDEADRNRPGVVGKPVYSGHYDSSDHQGFWIYHWMVTPNGESTRYLEDNETGWHAGKWDVNCSSAGICIDDDISHSSPTAESLEGIADVIRNNYGHLNIGPETVIGHNEIRNLACPGDQFLPQWKGKLLEMLGA